MAYALRKVWLEPETHEDARPRPARVRRPQRISWTAWQAQVGVFTLVGLVVTLLVTYVHSYARIAELEVQRRKLQQEQAKLSRECVLLNLELDRLASQGQITQFVQAQGLELPTADRIHYVRVAAALPVVPTAAAPRSASWLARSQRVMVAALGQAFQRLNYAPGAATVTR